MIQRKKNIRLLLSLAVICIATVILFVFTNTSTDSSVNKKLFQIEKLEQVDRVLLESPKGKVELSYNGTQWMVNKKYDADRQMVTVLFATLKQTLAKRAVAKQLRDSIEKEMSAGVKVSCFKGSAMAKQIWVVGDAQKNETYFQENDGNPYLVTIPGYRVFIAGIFELPVNEWRNKQVFNFSWQNIKNLDVTFPTDAKQNFKGSFNGKIFSLEGIATDTTKLDQFMDALLQLRAETILDSAQAKMYDSLLAQKPIMNVVIHDIANRSFPLSIYPIEKGKNFVVGKINAEVVRLNPFALKAILRKRAYFARQ